MTVLTCRESDNAAVFSDLAGLHIPDGSKVADLTYGTGAFWKEIDNERFDLVPSDLKDGVDMTATGYADHAFDVTIIDPPYMYNPKGTVKVSLSDPYNLNNQDRLLRTNHDVLTLYFDAIKECVRITKPKNGIVVVKCQDMIESGVQRWNHTIIHIYAAKLGLYLVDLFVVKGKQTPAIRWKNQKHARKNHSYFLVFKTGQTEAKRGKSLLDYL